MGREWGQDRTVRVWEAGTGRELLALSGHGSWVNSVAFSPDGRGIVSGDWNGVVRVWDAGSGEQLLTLKGDPAAVQQCGVHPRRPARRQRGRRQDGPGVGPRQWSATAILKGHTSTVYGVACSPDGQRLASGDHRGEVRVWEAGHQQWLLACTGHTGHVKSVALSPDGRRLASGGDDETVRVWDTRSGQELLTLQGLTTSVLNVAFSPDGRRVFGQDREGKIIGWDAGTGNPPCGQSGSVVACRQRGHQPRWAIPRPSTAR